MNSRKYRASVYSDYGSFLAEATEIAKDKISLYNQLVSAPVRKRTGSAGFQKFLDFIIFVLRRAGWSIFVAIAGLVGLGALGFFGGMGTMIAMNPIIAAAVAALTIGGGGGGVYLVWRHRDFISAQKVVGDRYKSDFDLLLKMPSGSDKEKEIESLLYKCTVSLCVEAFQISSDDFQQKIQADLN